jgi:hypothetical protein
MRSAHGALVLVSVVQQLENLRRLESHIAARAKAAGIAS